MNQPLSLFPAKEYWSGVRKCRLCNSSFNRWLVDVNSLFHCSIYTEKTNLVHNDIPSPNFPSRQLSSADTYTKKDNDNLETLHWCLAFPSVSTSRTKMHSLCFLTPISLWKFKFLPSSSLLYPPFLISVINSVRIWIRIQGLDEKGCEILQLKKSHFCQKLLYIYS